MQFWEIKKNLEPEKRKKEKKKEVIFAYLEKSDFRLLIVLGDENILL